MNISILGAGAWGTAVATVLAHNGHDVLLWAIEPDVVVDINENHHNSRYLPGHRLDERIQATIDLKQAVHYAQWIFEAVPVPFLRETLSKINAATAQEKIWVITSKGVEQQTLMLPSQIIDAVFGCKIKKAAMVGPSFAHEVAWQDLTGVTVASEDHEVAKQVQALLISDYFKPFLSADIIGVQVGAAVKNIMGIACGLLSGADMGDNTKAFLFTRALHEMSLLGVSLGAQQKTFYGLSGMGDMFLSAISKQSRNSDLGYRLGQGEHLDAVLNSYQSVPEGINTLQAVYQLIEQKGIDLPICKALYQLLFQQGSVEQIIKALAESA